MESRRLFYRLERRLRGITLREDHSHSYLVERLYTDYGENMSWQGIISTNAIAKAAIVSHSGVDLNKEQDAVLSLLHSAKKCVPYMVRDGKTYKDELEESRQRMVEEYQAYVRSHFDTEEEYQEYIKSRSSK